MRRVETSNRGKQSLIPYSVSVARLSSPGVEDNAAPVLQTDHRQKGLSYWQLHEQKLVAVIGGPATFVSQ